MQNKYYQCVQNDNEIVTPIDTIKAIKNVGFDGVFVQIYDNPFWEITQEEQVKLCKDLGLDILFAHLGYYKLDDMWENSEAGEKKVEQYKKNLDYCKENNIDTVVMHICSNRMENEPNSVGLKRFQQIVDYAEDLGIKIAFENTKNLTYFEYILDNIHNDNVFVCFDSGHCHLFYENEFIWEKLKGKILAVHLHDNDKSFDQHLLPLDGTIDWKDYLQKLDDLGYSGPVVLESFYSTQYTNQDVNTFYKDSLNKAHEIYKLL